MTTYARKINNQAIDVVTEDPAALFHPDIAAEFVTVPDGTVTGATYAAGKWTNPAPPGPAPAPALVYPKVGPIHFQMLFTPEEMIAAQDLRETDKVLASFWKLIDDPRTDTVDLALTGVQNAIEYTLTAVKGAGVPLDVQARKAQILTGILL